MGIVGVVIAVIAGRALMDEQPLVSSSPAVVTNLEVLKGHLEKYRRLETMRSSQTTELLDSLSNVKNENRLRAEEVAEMEADILARGDFLAAALAKENREFLQTNRWYTICSVMATIMLKY